MRRATLAILFTMGLLPALLAAQQNCAPNPAIAQMRLRQAELIKVKVEEISTEVPSSVRPVIHSFKDALAAAVQAGMACAAANADAATLQKALAKMLGANLPEKPSTLYSDDPKSGIFGASLKVAVSTPPNATELRAIEVSFGIPCSSDAMLLIYQTTPQGWHTVVRWQSGDYTEISGAFGDFFAYAVLPSSANALRVVVAHGTPWCTSRFSGVAMDVLGASRQTSGIARVIWHTERGLSRGDFQDRLRPMQDGFELRINAPATDIDGYERTVIYRYRVLDDHVTRIGPIAINGRGFVEEWLSMPWEEAQSVTTPRSLTEMKPIHERIAQLDKDPNTYVSYKYGPVRACQTNGQYEVEMDADPGSPEFYTIQETQNGYSMMNFATASDERCGSPDLMRDQKKR